MAGLHEYTVTKRVHVSAMADHKSNMTFALMSDDKKVASFGYECPTRVVAGHGSLSSISKAVVEKNCRRALILTDSGVAGAGLADLARNALGDLCVGVYDQIPSDPDLEAVDQATDAARNLNADCIVSVGGGSVMDAMTHAVEAMSSTMANPICDGMAFQAIRLISENLPVVVEDGLNEEARLNMQIAATTAGWAFTIAQVGLAHGMAHTVGTLHHVHHGAACSIVLPKVMCFNVDHVTAKLVQVAQALGVNTVGMAEREAALTAADTIEALMEKVGHPMRLRDVGVPEDNLPICAFHAVADTAVIFNGRSVADPNEVLEVFNQAY